ncbi:nitrate/nitrite transporter [Candidatus Methylomirabilis sp.]|uniref:nitrate/nitrite transporter n=1 Tax=Candidatus Methylomirabilis sp. TaxID=2032687 RepID=UPI003C72D316
MPWKESRLFKDFTKVGHPATLISAFLYFTIHCMIWVLVGVLGVFIANEFDLTASQKGLMVAAPILTGSLLRIPVGILADQFGAKKTGTVIQILVLLPLLGGWLVADSLAGVIAVGLLLGFAGASFTVAIPLASRWYPLEHQGLVNGIAGAGNIGAVLAALVAPRLAEVVGWRQVFGLALLPVLLTLAMSHWLAKESPNRPAPKRWSESLKILQESDCCWFSLFYAITFGGFVGLASFLVIFFYDQYGLSRVMAGNMAALCVLAGSLFRPVGGYLADRMGGVQLLSILFGAIGVLTAGVGLLPPLPVTTALLFLAMAAMGLGNGAIFQVIPQRFRSEIGVATGIVGTAGGIGGFFLPLLLGLLKDLTGSYGTGLLLFALASLAAVVALQSLRTGWQASWL